MTIRTEKLITTIHVNIGHTVLVASLGIFFKLDVRDEESKEFKP